MLSRHASDQPTGPSAEAGETAVASSPHIIADTSSGSGEHMPGSRHSAQEGATHGTDKPSHSAPMTTRSASARLPPELLDMSFRYLFHDWQSLRTRIRLMTSIGLVCKAWRAAVEPVAFDAVQLDPCDARAVAFFDPTTNGPGAKRLPLVHSCRFPSNALQSDHERRQQRVLEAEPDGDDDADDAAVKAAILAELGRPVADGSTLRAILVSMSNLQALVVCGVERAISRVFRVHKLNLVWPRLALLDLTWLRPTSRLVPVAAQLHLLPELRRLDLFIPATSQESNSDEQDAEDPGGASLVRPLDHLKVFSFSSRETDTDGLGPFTNLLSPVALLETVTWLGITPAALFEQLSRGSEPLRHLVLGCLALPEACACSSWPHLQLLGRRVLEKVSDNLHFDPDEPESADHPQLALSEFLNNLPPTVRSAKTAGLSDFDSDSNYPLRADKTFSSIQTRAHAPLTNGFNNGLLSRSFRGRPCVQSVVVCMEPEMGGDEDDEEEADAPVPYYFARYGDAEHLSEWHMLSPGIVDK